MGTTAKAGLAGRLAILKPLALMVACALACMPRAAFADGGSTDVTVRGETVREVIRTTTLAQTGVSTDAWKLLGAGVVLAISAIVALFVLRRGRHEG